MERVSLKEQDVDEEEEDEEEEEEDDGRGRGEERDSNEDCGLDVGGYNSEKSLSPPH